MGCVRWMAVTVAAFAASPAYAVSQITRDIVANSEPIGGIAPWLLLGAIAAAPFLIAWALIWFFDRRKASGRK